MAELDPGRMNAGRPVTADDEHRASLAAATWALGTEATGEDPVQACQDLLDHLGLTAFARQRHRRRFGQRRTDTAPPSTAQGAL